MESNWCGGLAAFWANWQAIAWLEWAKAIFDLLKGVAWPLAAFLVVWIFRKPLAKLIPQLRRAGPGGVEFDPPTQPTSAPPIVSLRERSIVVDTTGLEVSTAQDLEEKIRRDLQDVPDDERQNSLIRTLSFAMLAANFEFVFANIFQSQIDALRELARSGPKTMDEAENYFAERVLPVNREVFSEWGLERWSAYLRAQGLVNVAGGKISISQKGIDFLHWIDTFRSGFARFN